MDRASLLLVDVLDFLPFLLCTRDTFMLCFYHAFIVYDLNGIRLFACDKSFQS